MSAVLVKNAERMMTSAEILEEGIKISFADGQAGVVPFAEISDGDVRDNIVSVELPNLYEVVLNTNSGEIIELPWDFVRHYCDSSYRPRVEAVALTGRQVIGNRIRQLRKSTGLTQQALSRLANIGRVTLVRIETGEQSPRYETMVSLAQALGRPLEELVVGEQIAQEDTVAVSGASAENEADFKPIQVRGEDLSDTVLQGRD